MEKKKKGTVARALALCGRHKPLAIVGCVLSGVSSLVNLGPFLCVYFVLRELFTAGGNLTALNEQTMIHWGIWALVLAIGGFALYFAALMCTHAASFQMMCSTKYQLARHVATLPLGFHSANPSGKLSKIIDGNVAELENYVAHQLPDVAGSFVSPVAIIVLMLFFDWRLGLLCLLPIVVGYLIQMIIVSGKESMAFLKNYQESLEDMNNAAVEYVRGISVVKVFNQTVYSFQNFHNSVMRYRDYVVKYGMSMCKTMAWFMTSINAAFFFLIPAGIVLSRLSESPEQFLLSLVFYVVFTPSSAAAMMKLSSIGNYGMMVQDSLDRIEALLEEKPLPEPARPKAPSDATVEFQKVSFTYAGSEAAAVRDVSFVAVPGSVTALVGASGSGKSTVASLIPRFWDAQEGSVRIGGVDVREISTTELMNAVGFVFQDSFLFKRSVLENIRLGCPDATREEVLAAAEAAQCLDILDKLPQGVDTVLGKDGLYLSGGEQQRIALARAILKNAPVIVLDEATAFADPENEHNIQLALASLTKNKTVIMIAHRLSTIQNADQILVLDQGSIRERGTHQDLLAAGGQYAGMWRSHQQSVAWHVGKEAGQNV